MIHHHFREWGEILTECLECLIIGFDFLEHCVTLSLWGCVAVRCLKIRNFSQTPQNKLTFPDNKIQDDWKTTEHYNIYHNGTDNLLRSSYKTEFKSRKYSQVNFHQDYYFNSTFHQNWSFLIFLMATSWLLKRMNLKMANLERTYMHGWGPFLR